MQRVFFVEYICMWVVLSKCLRFQRLCDALLEAIFMAVMNW